MKVVFIGMLMVVLFAASCNDTVQKSANTSTSAATATAGQTPEQAPEQAAVPAAAAIQAGTQLTLASGESVEVLSVGKFDETQASLNGLVAIEGRVAEVYPERGAMVLVDVENMAGCKDGCCPQAQVPVQVNLSDFTGELPGKDAQIVVIGELHQQELGFEFAVREIRGGNEVLLKQSESQA
jgi:hypothetical protein